MSFPAANAPQFLSLLKSSPEGEHGSPAALDWRASSFWPSGSVRGEGYAVQLPEPANRLQATESTGPRLQEGRERGLKTCSFPAANAPQLPLSPEVLS